MSTARWGRKWADVDEEEEEEEAVGAQKTGGTRFETTADEHGIKTVIEYIERNNKTYKVTKRVKQNIVTKWTNESMNERKNMVKFGKAASNTPAQESELVIKSSEDVMIELTRKNVVQLSAKDDAEDRFYEESIAITDNLFKEKKVWTDLNRDKQMARDDDDAKPGEEKKPEAATPAAGAAAAGGERKPGAYVPPSLRNGGGGDGKGKGKDSGNQVEASLRITNLSEDVREGDLQELFGKYGRLQRVYLAKDMQTFTSKGFAFVTYYTKEDAQRAIDKLHGHGYDNLIMQVMWAKPRA